MEKDECVAPSEITTLPFYDSDSLENATSIYWYSRECPVFPATGTLGRGFWYQLTGTGSCITASTAGSVIDTVIGVYKGDCHEDELVCMANNDDAMDSFSSFVAWRSTAGTIYRILVAGYGDETGRYNLNVTVCHYVEYFSIVSCEFSN